ncbi:MAG TPA: hypothetical protein VGR35_17980 [Tepidisphaeraceae bacterium]|nr:hypothetical protein [Tepidisphaeraceae bacterium]
MDWKVPTIPDDAPCHCGYNLRGLSYDHACPECGRAVCESTRLTFQLPTEVTPQGRDELFRVHKGLADASDACGFSTQACWVVDCGVSYAAMQAGQPRQAISAGEVCRGLREYARLHYGGLARGMFQLDAMGIRCSEDVGEIVYALVVAGLVLESPDDSRAAFAGLFTLENFQTVGLS